MKKILKKRKIPKKRKAVKKVIRKKKARKVAVRRRPKEKRPLIAKTLPPSEAVIANLLEKASLRGFVTENELLHTFAEAEDYLRVYENFLDDIERKGIQIVETGEMVLGKRKEQKEQMQKLGLAGAEKNTPSFRSFRPIPSRCISGKSEKSRFSRARKKSPWPNGKRKTTKRPNGA